MSEASALDIGILQATIEIMTRNLNFEIKKNEKLKKIICNQVQEIEYHKKLQSDILQEIPERMVDLQEQIEKLEEINMMQESEIEELKEKIESYRDNPEGSEENNYDR